MRLNLKHSQMANKTQQIRIESILGGFSQYTNVSGPDQYLGGIGVNPNLSVIDADVNPVPFLGRKSGVIAVQGASMISSVLSYPVVHFTSVPQSETEYTYAYCSGGSLYTTGNYSVTAIADAGELSNSSGNGMAYYDNYLYLAKDTTIARYGPLNGTPTMNGDYWVTTLGKPQLSDVSPYPNSGNVQISNHQLHRHSDGRLYFFDVLDGAGVLHFISTKKTTVEGDTDNGSTYNALNIGYNLLPTAICSYGDLLALAVCEREPGTFNSQMLTKPKLYFWDGVATSPNGVIWNDVPNHYVTAMTNVNGNLLLFTGFRPFGGVPGEGFNISLYLGGNSFKTLFKTYGFTSPLQSATCVQEDSVVFGSTVFYDNPGTSTRSGLFRVSLDGVIQPVMPSPSFGSSHTISAIYPVGYSPNEEFYLGTYAHNYICQASDSCDGLYGRSFFLSQIYNLGKKYKITRLELNLSRFLDADQIITASIWRDSSTEASDIYTFPTINTTNYSNKKKIIFRPTNLTGEYNFFLKLEWSGASESNTQPAVLLPITIDYEIIDE